MEGRKSEVDVTVSSFKVLFSLEQCQEDGYK